jgi:hypothetical protein
MSNKPFLNTKNLVGTDIEEIIGLYQDKINKIYYGIDEKSLPGSDR